MEAQVKITVKVVVPTGTYLLKRLFMAESHAEIHQHQKELEDEAWGTAIDPINQVVTTVTID